jgi:hypothetical protein
MGPWSGFVTGLAETIEYVATTAVIVFFSASYADSITDELFGLSRPTRVWWLILYAVFLLLNRRSRGLVPLRRRRRLRFPNARRPTAARSACRARSSPVASRR